MAKTFDTLLTEFIAANDKKILDNPDRFKSLFLDFSQNQCRAEAMVFSQFLASPQAAELKNTDYADSTVLKNSAERFHQAYLFDKNTCELVVTAYAQVLGLDKKKPEPEIVTEKAGIAENAGTVSTTMDNKSFFMDKRFRIVAAVFVAVIGIAIFAVISSNARVKELERLHASTPADIQGEGEEEEVPEPLPAGMVFLQGGTFTMGSPASEVGRDYDETQHQVTVSSFSMGRYEVTQAEYEKIMGTNPSAYRGANLPVENVSWFDAVEYCNWRSQREGLTPAYTISGANVTWNRNANGYRLPTEAEWEYACRAGTTTAYNTGNSITERQSHFNTSSSASVGSFRSNAWRLYDMHGNVWEWCWDWYGAYTSGAQNDPVGPASGDLRVLRGGSWGSYAVNLRSARRNYGAPSHRGSGIGFRLARNAQ